MLLVFAVEIYTYFLSLLLLSTKIKGYYLRKKALPFSLIILSSSIPLQLITSEKIFSIVLPITFFLTIFCAKISLEKSKILHLIYIFLLLYFSNIVISTCLVFLLPTSIFFDIIIEFITHIIMLISCLLFCCKNISNKIKAIYSWISPSIKTLILLVVVACAVLLGWINIILNFPEIIYNANFVFFTKSTIVIFIVTLTIFFPMLILNSITKNYFKNLTMHYEKQIKAQAEHYTALSKANFELRRFRHDFNNIQIGVRELITEQRYNEAINMLCSPSKSDYDIATHLLSFDTGNGIVDALLADKQEKAKTINATIVFKGAISPNALTATELCVLFGNTLDNAIEACEKISTKIQKNIYIHCNCNSGFMFLNITNPISEPIIIKDNNLVTTKADKNLHGFGLYSLDKIVHSHNGELTLSCNNHKFIVEVSISIQ